MSTHKSTLGFTSDTSKTKLGNQAKATAAVITVRREEQHTANAAATSGSLLSQSALVRAPPQPTTPENVRTEINGYDRLPDSKDKIDFYNVIEGRVSYCAFLFSSDRSYTLTW